MAISYAKVDANLDSSPRIRAAGADGREVFLFILRRCAQLDAQGCIPAANVEPEYLAAMLMRDVVTACHGLSRAVTAGLLTVTDTEVAICGWSDDWSKRPMSEAERQRKRRNSLKSPDVTICHDANVTCPDSHTREEKRREEKRERDVEEPAADKSALPPATKIRKRPEPVLAGTPEDAQAVLDALGAKNGVSYRAGKAHTTLIRRLLGEGYTVEDLGAVVEYCAGPTATGALGWASDAKMRPFLRPETLFGPVNIEKYADPARSWAAKKAAPRTWHGQEYRR
jgi:uncharacterized phage protein (TIGR02220 family)